MPLKVLQFDFVVQLLWQPFTEDALDFSVHSELHDLACPASPREELRSTARRTLFAPQIIWDVIHLAPHDFVGLWVGITDSAWVQLTSEVPSAGGILIPQIRLHKDAAWVFCSSSSTDVIHCNAARVFRCSPSIVEVERLEDFGNNEIPIEIYVVIRPAQFFFK